jgi:hypothetical protein
MTTRHGRPSSGRVPHHIETGIIMKLNNYVLTLAGVVLAASAHAQTTANTPPIGQAVSGNNSTAAGTSGTGLNTNGTARTGSRHAAAGEEAAGVNSQGQVTGKSTAVLGVAPSKADNVNAQATNTTAPNNKDPNPAASGGRGKAGTKAEQEVIKANSRSVHEVPGDRLKTEASANARKKKRAEARQKGLEKEAEHAAQGKSGS